MRHCRSWQESRRVIFALISAILVAQSACGGGQPPASAPGEQGTPVTKQVPGGNPEQGRVAIQKYGCGSCHTIPGISGANGTVGPTLAGFANRGQIADAVPNTPDNLVRWIQNPQAVKPGTAMPTLGVTEADARNIAAYLYTLK